jgi:hypothetical protein
LTTRFGDLDLTFAPSGFADGFEALREGALAMTIDGVRVLVARLDDVIASKEAAGRDKDFQALPRLIRLHRDPQNDPRGSALAKNPSDRPDVRYRPAVAELHAGR